MAKILNIVETAYRAVLEEQDDTVIWLTHSLRNAGAEIGILLRGNAVNYAVAGQDASGLTIGTIPLSNPPSIDKDLLSLMKKEVPVYLLREDAEERGIQDGQLIEGISSISREEIPSIFQEYQQIWHW